jgi:thioredoxin 1
MAEHLTKDQFLRKVFDYERNTEWQFEGERPCIIDFYADWCQPCKLLGPVLEELADEYDGRIDVYKVNTEAEPELAGAFGIRSIPSMLFVPKDGKPQMAVGLMPKGTIKQAIADVLGVEEP